MADTPATVPVTHSIALPTGDLTVKVLSSDFPLDELCGFAARRNPKRGFLFVSKVLGKHIPVRPSLMRSVHTHLAAKIPTDLPGPIVFVGMAETAVALGHGVYDEYARLSERSDMTFLHSTRYRLDKTVAMEFREEHSHAADHIIYLPDDERNRLFFENARSLVLVDDEASTGATFINLARAFKERMPSVQQVVTAVITDWRGPARAAANERDMPVPSRMVSVLEGEYQFAPAPGLVAVEMPKVVGDNGLKDHLIAGNYGRHGLSSSFACVENAWQVAAKLKVDCDLGAAKTLVLGTGEFAYPPFLVAEALERLGVDVFYQSTTRSPVMIDASGAIAAGLNFQDNYGDGIPNFVYNVTPGQYERVIIAHETPAGSLDQTLVDALNAYSLEM
ncbi:MAG: phosphoribosyltransferase [Cyanobacteria bacterium REEB67]|nr:phosphoribosyltransferase [Cyanobacteria bacterium REEB67]